MVDLALFRRPAFVGAQTTAFAISSSMFAMFLYLTLYLQNILGLSPLKTGLVFLPLSVVSFFAAPIAGRLSTRVPIRILLGSGLALNAVAMWSMSRVTPSSHWTVLLPGFIVGGIGIGLVNAPLASTAVSTVRQERAGMASGINNTFRQLGIATGIAALGAIFASKVDAERVRAACERRRARVVRGRAARHPARRRRRRRLRRGARGRARAAAGLRRVRAAAAEPA